MMFAFWIALIVFCVWLLARLLGFLFTVAVAVVGLATLLLGVVWLIRSAARRATSPAPSPQRA